MFDRILRWRPHFTSTQVDGRQIDCPAGWAGGRGPEHHRALPLLQREAVPQHLSQRHDMVAYLVHSKMIIT